METRGWRDSQEWTRMGLPMSTTSNAACKLYDAALTQWVGFYNAEEFGGIVNTMDSMVQSHPEFVMGRVLSIMLPINGYGKMPDNQPELQGSLETLSDLATRPSTTPREKLHAEAVQLYAQGDWPGACRTWEDISLTHPTDLAALKMHQNAYLMCGDLQRPSLEVLSRVQPHWTPAMTDYGYVRGMFAFSLCENNYFPQAEAAALQALARNPRDCWATHARAHVLEMLGRQTEGAQFMQETRADWESGVLLAGHNSWHWALYHVDQGDYDKALDIYDSYTAPNLVDQSLYDVYDAASMLYRLEMNGVAVGDRWGPVHQAARPYTAHRGWTFSDAHVLLACLRAHHHDDATEILKSIQQHIQSGCGGEYGRVARRVGTALCEALAAHEAGRPGDALTLLYPLRHSLPLVGGSNAQRELFHLFLIHAAKSSDVPQHQRIARALIQETCALKESHPQQDRLLASIPSSLP